MGARHGLAAAHVLARTAMDLMTDGALRAEARADFKKRTEGMRKRVLFHFRDTLKREALRTRSPPL